MADLSELKQQLESLRRRGAQAQSAPELQKLLDETRTVLRPAFQTELEEEARNLFRELRDRLDNVAAAASDPASAKSTRLERLAARVRHEQTRLRSGTQADVEQAVGGLYGILRELTASSRDAELRKAALDSLVEAAGRSNETRRKVLEMLSTPEVAGLPGLKRAINRIENPSDAAQVAEAAPPTTPDTGQRSDVAQRLTQARRLFYAGDYFEAADILNEILQVDPHQAEARDRLAQVEDNIRRGIVPDSRVPFEARAAFGRGQSLERAGRFEEAHDAYRQALEEARSGGPLLQNWQPAVEAMVRVDNSIIARETRDEADALLRSDKWPEAAEKYGVALRLLPDDAYALERHKLLQTIQSGFEDLRDESPDASRDPAAQSQTAVETLRAVRTIRKIIPDSHRLQYVERELARVTVPLRASLVARSQDLTSQAGLLSNIADRRRLLGEAFELLQTAHALAPDEDLAGQVQAARVKLSALEQVDETLNEIGRLMDLDTDPGRRQAADMLRDLWGYSQDARYLQLTASLHRQYLERVRSALQSRRWRVAREWLAAARDDVFSVLEQTEEVWKLEREIAAARRAPWFKAFAWVAGIAIVLVGVGYFARPIFALAAGLVGGTTTATAAPVEVVVPSETPVPTATIAPSATSLPTDTATLAPSATNPPTLTPTPVLTATEVPLYGAVSNEGAARLSPDALAPWAFTLRLADPVQVLDQVYDTDGRLWYKIRYVRGDSELVGWAQARDINVLPTPSS